MIQNEVTVAGEPLNEFTKIEQRDSKVEMKPVRKIKARER